MSRSFLLVMCVWMSGVAICGSTESIRNMRAVIELNDPRRREAQNIICDSSLKVRKNRFAATSAALTLGAITCAVVSARLSAHNKKQQKAFQTMTRSGVVAAWSATQERSRRVRRMLQRWLAVGGVVCAAAGVAAAIPAITCERKIHHAKEILMSPVA
jgi:hypothetical protein